MAGVDHKSCRSSSSVLALTGRVMNQVLSIIVFCVLDVIDFLLCYVYKVVDFLVEAEWKPCYCSTSAQQTMSSGSGGSINAASKIVRLTSSACRLQLEEISDTLYTRPTTLQRLKLIINNKPPASSTTIIQSNFNNCDKVKKGRVTINSMLRPKIGRHQLLNPIPRWSDCDCKTCHSWASSCKQALFVLAQGPKDFNNVVEDVIFIHGFISSSEFWTETLFPNFSSSVKSMYRLFAMDLLGFGRSPKPNDSLYTLREHLEMIESSVLRPHKVKSFHIVAHSLGCILALALAVKYPHSVKSLTLLAPPYFPVPKGEEATQHVMKRVAPRRVWPVITFGASIACWYEHLSRTICLLICKNHRLWTFLTNIITRNRMRTYLIEGFCCHTHNAAWHTLHNIICGSAAKMDAYLETIKNSLKCEVNIFHGRDDDVIPVECSYNVQSRVPRARVKVFDNKDHITIVVGRQKAFARELEQIWTNSNQP
ncbi:probable lysophospholipase BODYGUARD 1 [Cornus florida]|uniref:probable lysophospholipase BODYGUARD 1 n=1 Tax=Cornus florida TaxID=4283 RepID=UPI00289AF6FC|nr:probable lysophospholipase BODYGUARD 1 [Cornus florida]